MPGESDCCREQAALCLIIFVAVVLGADHNMLLIEQARRDGDVRRAAGRCKIGLESRSGGRRPLVHVNKIV